MTRLDWVEKLTPESLLLTGSAGSIEVIDLKAGTIAITDAAGERREEDCGPLPWMHWGLMENFVEHLRGNGPLACDGIEGRKSTVILDIVDALGSGTDRVAVDYGG